MTASVASGSGVLLSEAPGTRQSPLLQLGDGVSPRSNRTRPYFCHLSKRAVSVDRVALPACVGRGTGRENQDGQHWAAGEADDSILGKKCNITPAV
jgi:hypothetical protein